MSPPGNVRRHTSQSERAGWIPIGQQVSVLLGNGDGTFQPLTVYPIGADVYSVKVGDFNRDGKLDIVLNMKQFGQDAVLLGNGDGTFKAVEGFPSGGSPEDVAPAFLNHDLYPDLVASNTGEDTIAVLLNTSKPD